VWTTLGSRGPWNGPHERAWIEALGKDTSSITFAIVLRDGHHLIGTTGLGKIHTTNRSAEFGIAIGDVDCHNQGYGTEAARLVLRYGFEELNLNRIELTVLANNPRAIRAYEKAGFQHEAVARQAVYRHGRYEDLLRMAILRERWDQLSPPLAAQSIKENA